MKKPELLITAASLSEIERYAQSGCDAVLFGESTYGLRMPGTMNKQEVVNAIRTAHEYGVKAYVSVHRLMTNDLLDGLGDYLRALMEWQADAIVFSDPAVLMLAREQGVDLPLHWDGEMTSTNPSTARFWESKGAVRAVLARELNLEELIAFRKLTQMELQVQVHGMTPIYDSMRHLVRSYMEHLGKDEPQANYGPEEGLYLVEYERRNRKLPIFEDETGTHIMSPDDICMIENLDELMEAEPDSLKIEGMLKSPEYNETVVRCYREAIDALYADPDRYVFRDEWLEQIEQLQPEGRELTYGFYYKEQVY